MKKWHIATLAAAAAVASIGVAGAALNNGPQAGQGTVVVAPGREVEANPNWVPNGAAPTSQGVIPPAPALPAATGAVLFSTDFSNHNATQWQSPLLARSDKEPLWIAREGVLQRRDEPPDGLGGTVERHRPQ